MSYCKKKNLCVLIKTQNRKKEKKKTPSSGVMYFVTALTPAQARASL